MKKFKRRAACVLTALALTLGLSACGSAEKKEATEAVTETTSDAATDGETVYPISVTDSYGNTVTIEEEPEKLISVAPNLTELIYKLGAEEKLVGRSDYCDYPSEVLDVESVGNIQMPDIEKIISLEPDVVIVSTHFESENAEKLEEAGIPVVALYDETDVEGVYAMIKTLGKVINRNAEASACVEEMQNTIAEVQEKVSGLEAPTVYYVIGYGEYGDFTAGGDTFTGKMLEMAGGDNIAKDISGWSITLEELVEADPSIIIINEFMKSDFMSLPNYSDLTAVKEGNVYVLDTNMLDRQGYRNAEGILELAKIFHPEAFE